MKAATTTTRATNRTSLCAATLRNRPGGVARRLPGSNALKQLVAITAMNIRNVRLRLGAASVAVLGVAAVVGVFAAVLSMAAGFERTMAAAGSADTAIVLRKGAAAELNSGFGNETRQIIAQAPGVRRDPEGRPIVSGELYVVVDRPLKATMTSANVPLRGVEAHAMAVRDHLRLVDGRNFQTGKQELIVGRAAQQQFAGLDLGAVVKFGSSDWKVVGVFEDGGSVSESELWCDIKVLQNAYKRGNSYQSVRVRLTAPAAIEGFKAALAADPRLNVSASSEAEYYAGQSRDLARFIRIVGYPLAILMAIGAVFGALNTMYASVAARAREIATLRAMGFGPGPVALATLMESGFLSLLGGVLGGALTFLIFNGYQVATLNSSSFSQVVFAFAVTPDLLLEGLLAAVVIGLLGGLFPALRAARMPVATALREL